MSDLSRSDIDSLHELFSEWDADDSPGMSVCVTHRAKIVAESAFGMADLSHGVPNLPRTKFHVASLSKQFTSAAIVLLEHQGLLAITDSVRDHLPELPEIFADIQLHHLIHHTSGIRDQWALLRMAGYRRTARFNLDLVTDADVVSLALRQRSLNHVAGAEYRYSNTGTTLLAQVVERISGQTLRNFTSTQIFEPLGMRDSHFRDDHTEINVGEAYGYVRGDDGDWRVSITNFDTVGATSLYSTAPDLAKWASNFSQPRIGGANFGEMMHRTRSLSGGANNPYAFGLTHGRYRGTHTIEHTGGDAGYRSIFLRIPEHELAVIVLGNCVFDGHSLSRQVVDRLLGEKLDEAPLLVGDEVTSDMEAKRYSGTFFDPESGAIATIGRQNGVLAFAVGAQLSEGEREPLRYCSDNSLTLSWGRQARLENGEGQQPGGIRLVENGPVLRRQACTTARDLGDYLGVFYSDELDVEYVVKWAENGLVVDQPRHRDLSLAALGDDLFAVGSDMTLRFVRHGNVVDEMWASGSTGQAHNICFVRRAQSARG